LREKEAAVKIFIGIDPGVSGGIAVIDTVYVIVRATKMPITERDIFDCLDCSDAIPVAAMIELVHSMPNDGVRQAFTFGQNYGSLRMALAALQIPLEAVSPAKWQAPFRLPPLSKFLPDDFKVLGKKEKQAARSRAKTQKKNAHLRRAQELFPAIKVTHAIADALLIAEYCRRTHGGARSLTEGGAG
jgi:hypothetical protein